ncbi:MAG: diguanylate cyclase [Campylobacterales bacterium]|nr:diguanylate cyclase [Campylobacterales bacterium]
MRDKAVVLIVDDARINIQTLAHILKDDYTVKVASGGAQALELVVQDPTPDLILLDVGMPEVSGYDVCRILCENTATANIPIIFVTGKDSIEEEEYGLSLGAVDYITKPIHPSIVKARVKTHVTLKRQHDLLKTMAIHDQLTGLYNRHYLVDMMAGKVSEAKRYEQPLSVIMVDIDHFKEVNDSFGHLEGDKVLQKIAQILQDEARREDIVARFGGEEMVIILNNCPLTEASIKAEKLRKKIEESEPEGIAISASFGIVQMSDINSTCERLFKCADDALYKAKALGRNRVEVYGK